MANDELCASSAALLEELTNEKRFLKLAPPTLTETPGPKGLFIAANDDPDWAQSQPHSYAGIRSFVRPGYVHGHERHCKPAHPRMGTQRTRT